MASFKCRFFISFDFRVKKLLLTIKTCQSEAEIIFRRVVLLERAPHLGWSGVSPGLAKIKINEFERLILLSLKTGTLRADPANE